MTIPEIARQRLISQRIARVKLRRPGDVVSWMGAMQAQDFTSVRWAVGLRCESATDADIEQAIIGRTILRTWLLRGTLHLVSPADIRWMLGLVAPRLISGSAGRNRQLELNEPAFSKSCQILTKTLQGGRVVTRAEVIGMLERAGISTAGQRGYHILARAALEGLICFGPPQGKQPTFVLLDEWIPPGRRLERDEALAELAGRYFSSHGPATLTDVIWWSGTKITEARQALELAKATLQKESIGDQDYWLSNTYQAVLEPSPAIYLLPAFDEYYIGYTDRSAILDPRFDRQLVSSNGVFRPMVVIDGEVVGKWKAQLRKDQVAIALSPFDPGGFVEAKEIVPEANRFGEFLGRSAILT
jgi:hypothetical protein